MFGGSWSILVRVVCEIEKVDTRQREKEKEKEKEQAPGDRTSKVRRVAKDHRTWPADDPFGTWFGLVRLVTPISDFF
ncbi:hypothetical protein Bca52824_023472 [Brassica carinata]|uniref:Uncharacterized protein n=1 Tax=Brassica carinata TaxID=52824 RepID=A0A8X7VIA9_BRACI|nr:hypothetical protein Bca52824_023472 [Brassica carinata]